MVIGNTQRDGVNWFVVANNNDNNRLLQLWNSRKLHSTINFTLNSMLVSLCDKISLFIIN